MTAQTNNLDIEKSEDALLYLLEGDPIEAGKAYEWVFYRYLPNVTRFISQRLIYPEEKSEVEDLVMMTFLGFWSMNENGKLTTETNLEATLIHIAKFKINDYLDKRSAKKRKRPTDDAKTNMLIDAMSGTEIGRQLISVDISIVESELRRMLPELAPYQRMVARAMLSRFGEIIEPKEVHEQTQIMGMNLTYVQVKNALTGLIYNIRKSLRNLDRGDS